MPLPEPSPAWARGMEVPPWLTLREGTRPLVVVAPHGGRRLRALRPGDRVNDLHTAPLALELAERVGAHAIVNHGLDRNDADLNRITHLSTRAPEVLRLLHAAVEAASQGGEVPFVLFVHGWNMVVPCCDIGIGLTRRGGVLRGRHPTLGLSRYHGAVVAIERELAQRGLAAAIGRRYAASGKDNAAQIFSGRHADHEHELVAALARLAAEDRVDAAQLELGIPLRWPGPLRDALLDGLEAALAGEQHAQAADGVPHGSAATASGVAPVASGAAPGARSAWNLPPLQPKPEAVPAEGLALQALLDREGRRALFCGVETTGPHAMASRFCVVDADGSMLLLVGEGEWDGTAGRYRMDHVEWRLRGDGSAELRLAGPMVRYATHEAYLDLEQGLADCELVHGEVSLRLARDASGHGRLRGELLLGSERQVVDCVAFVDRPGRAPRREGSGLRVLQERNGKAEVRHVDPEVLGASQVLARVPVWMPLGGGAFARRTFGMMRPADRDADGSGVALFDRVEIFGTGDARAGR